MLSQIIGKKSFRLASADEISQRFIKTVGGINVNWLVCVGK